MKIISSVSEKLLGFLGIEFNQKWRRLVIMLVCLIAYCLTFVWLESLEPENLHIIHTAIDDQIPFIPAFIIPYDLWFPLIGFTMAYYAFFQKNDAEFHSYILMTVLGVVVFIIISLAWPNGLDLRPDVSGEGFWNGAVRMLYASDTPTNVFPSLHVYQSLAALVPTWRLQRHKHKKLTAFVVVLSFMICISTVFLKQHSIVDAVAGVAFAVVFYLVSYKLVTFEKKKKIEEKIAV